MELEKLLCEKKKQVKELKTREEELEIATRQLMIDQEKIAAKEKKLQQEEKQMNAFTNQLIRKEELFTQQLAVSSKREKGIQEETEKINKLICLALEKYSSDLVFTKTVDTLQVENQQIISKIIGKEGRNINAFERITGTELIIDRESDELSVQISSFNSLRRAIGLQTLHTLIKEARFSPLHIEKIYEKVSLEINELII